VLSGRRERERKKLEQEAGVEASCRERA